MKMIVWRPHNKLEIWQSRKSEESEDFENARKVRICLWNARKVRIKATHKEPLWFSLICIIMIYFNLI